MRRAGIPPFAKDVSSWSTRIGIVGRYSQDLWEKWWRDNQNADSVNRYVNEKFRAHILSEEKLNDDLAAVMAKFNEDMAAGRNRLYAELKLTLKGTTIPAAGVHTFMLVSGLVYALAGVHLLRPMLWIGLLMLASYAVLVVASPPYAWTVTGMVIAVGLAWAGIAARAEGRGDPTR